MHSKTITMPSTSHCNIKLLTKELNRILNPEMPGYAKICHQCTTQTSVSCKSAICNKPDTFRLIWNGLAFSFQLSPFAWTSHMILEETRKNRYLRKHIWNSDLLLWFYLKNLICAIKRSWLQSMAQELLINIKYM